MRCKQIKQKGKGNLGTIVKNKRIFQRGYNNFNNRGYYFVRRQRGRGIGSAFLGLARFLIPLIQSGYKAIKSEAVTTGKQIFNDIKDTHIENMIKKRGQQAVQNLRQKASNKIESMMSGEGLPRKKRRRKTIKRRKTPKRVQSIKIARRKRTLNKKPRKRRSKLKKIDIKKIFG